METTELSASELRARMFARRVTVTRLGREAGIEQSTISAILNGRDYLGPRRAARLGAAIIRLGLDRDLDEDEKAEQPGEPVIRLRQL